jgi:hypothetical protein
MVASLALVFVPARVQLPAVFVVLLLPFFHELETTLAFPLKKKSFFERKTVGDTPTVLLLINI